MSTYTTQLRWIVEQAKADGKDVYKAVGLDSYPIFDETYRDRLNNKIINHYYFREIGVETAELFRFMMSRQMAEIMPYYNQLYESENLITDPLLSRDIWSTDNEHRDFSEDYQKDNTNETNFSGKGTSQTNSQDNSSSVYSDTPMNMLADGLGNNGVKNLQYATNVTFDDDTSLVNGSTTTTNQNNVDANEIMDRDTKEDRYKIHHETGYMESQAEILKKYRDTMLNIDMMVIDRLNDLFMGVW